MKAILTFLAHFKESYFIINEKGELISASQNLFQEGDCLKLKGKKTSSMGYERISLESISHILPNTLFQPKELFLNTFKKTNAVKPISFYCFQFYISRNGYRAYFFSPKKVRNGSIPNNGAPTIGTLVKVIKAICSPLYIGTLIYNKQDKINEISSNLAKALGYKPSELLGYSYTSLLPEMPKNFKRTALNGSIGEMKSYREIKVSKAGKPFLFNNILMRLDSNSINEKYLNIISLTDPELRSSFNNFSAIPLKERKLLSYTTNLKGKISWVCEEFIEFTGYPKEDIIGDTPYLFTGERSNAFVIKEMLDHIAKSADDYEFELILYKKNGDPFYAHHHIHKLTDENGQHKGYLINLTDTTREKRERNQLQQLIKICDLSQESMLVTDEKGKIEWVNKRFEERTGYKLKHIKRKKPGSFLQGPKTSEEDIISFREKLSKGIEFRQNIINYSKEGEIFNALISVSPVKDQEGKVTHFVAVQNFISESVSNVYDNTNDTGLLDAMQQIATQYEELNKKRDEMEMQNRNINEAYQALYKLNDKFQHSINYAQKLQRSIMPNQAFLESKLANAFIFYQPKDMVSGDFYWHHENEKQVRIVIGDCTGHGVPGAFMTIMAINLLDQYVKNCPEENLLEALTQLDLALKEKLMSSTSDDEKAIDGFEFGLISIDKQTGEYHFCGAKLNLLRINQEEVNALKSDRFPIGGNYKLYKNKCFETLHRFYPKSGECLYLCSDGFQDQFNTDNLSKYTSKRLKELLQKIHTRSMDEQKKILTKEFKKWKGKQAQTDDVLVFGMSPLPIKNTEPNNGEVIENTYH
ncbi:MAG: PAS domain-containing protein [Bacteroidota bacterium]